MTFIALSCRNFSACFLCVYLDNPEEPVKDNMEMRECFRAETIPIIGPLRFHSMQVTETHIFKSFGFQ